MCSVCLSVAARYVLPLLLLDAAGIMELTVASEFIPSGDHEVVVCGVTSWKIPGTAAAKPQPLYTAYLRQQGYL